VRVALRHAMIFAKTSSTPALAPHRPSATSLHQGWGDGSGTPPQPPKLTPTKETASLRGEVVLNASPLTPLVGHNKVMHAMAMDAMTALAGMITARRTATADTSYTRQLLDAGTERCARKFGEEAVEVIIAATAQTPKALTTEAADVIYHLLVLLESRGVAWADVAAELDSRRAKSGLAEKAGRAPS
jgi:phosphoribosyl-ATP pyrophosphohydrolase